MSDRSALRTLFDEIDADGGGSLDRGEVAQMAEKMGAAMSEHELDAAMAEMDEDGSGDVSFDELVKWFSERKTASPLKDLMQKKLPSNETGLERELLKVMKGVRDSALAAANFVPLDDVALTMPHRRRRAIIPAASPGHARALQPAGHAFRSQADVGKTWSKTIDDGVKGRVLEIIAPLCKKEPTGCVCTVYDRVISRRYKPEPGVPGLELKFCLCKERTDQAQRSAGGGASDDLIKKLFSEIDADHSGTLDREEIKLLALQLGKPMTERQLDDAMASMDADGGGEIDMDEFATWFRSEGAASASWASALLQCAHCAEYGLGFSCGGWTEKGYTAWETPAPAPEAEAEGTVSSGGDGYGQSCSAASLRGYTREGGSRGGLEPEPEPEPDSRKQRRRRQQQQQEEEGWSPRKMAQVGSRYRSPKPRDLRNRYALYSLLC